MVIQMVPPTDDVNKTDWDSYTLYYITIYVLYISSLLLYHYICILLVH